MRKKVRLGIIFGGKSGEHEVSLMSAASVIGAVDKEKYEPVLIGITKKGKWLLYDGPAEKIENGQWEEIAENALKENPKKYELTVLGSTSSLKDRMDIVFPVLHGPFGEDGTIQGLFEMADIPYVGCGVTGSAAAMDKALSKAIFQKEKLPICKYKVVLESDISYDIEGISAETEKELGFPVFVKPANLGSSVGITKAADREQLVFGISEALKYDRKIVIEEFIDCREIETGIIGNGNPQAAAVGEIIPSNDFYDYEAKYFDGGKSKLCVPADIPDETREKIREIAVKAYKALDCCGFARVDFFIDKKSGEIFLNEINTIPGFTRFSMFPLLWKECGVEYPELIERLVEFGFERHESRK